jgi:diacylglycerol O-acyltransferase
LDVSFLHVEDEVSHMHLGSVGLFEGPPPSEDELLRAIEGKLHLAPRWRQRVRFIPLEAGRPVWVDDPHFNLRYHVRRTGLPSPGGDAELRRLVGRVMSQQLHRDRPLWELWVVEGVDDDRWALISKLHHAMVDGISGSNLITVLLDEERDPARAKAPAWSPRDEPAGVRLVADALLERARWPLREARAALGALGDPLGWAEHAAQTVQGLVAYAGLARRPPSSRLNGPIGPHRVWASSRAQLSDVKEIRAVLHGTVNDVVLTAIAGGFRAFLLSRGEDVARDRTLRTLVPVSVRARGQSGAYDNRVSAMFADLPVGIEDPVARLRAMRTQMRHLKDTHEAVAGEVLTSLGGFAPEMLLALGARVATRVPQRNVNTVTTNVPGPQRPLFLAGRRMLEAFPYVPLGGHVRVGVAIYSYDGGLGFGVTGDEATALDVGVLGDAIEASMRELLAAAREQTRHRPSAAPPSRRARRSDRARG